MVRQIVDAGLDSIRVSLNSVISDRYHSYYQPKRYRFEDLLESIRIAKDSGVYVSLNLLTMPGWNDAEEEVEATVKLVNEFGVNMIQTRTLNIDPDLYARHVPPPQGRVLGVPAMLDSWRRECPDLRVGNHSPAVRRGQVRAD